MEIYTAELAGVSEEIIEAAKFADFLLTIFEGIKTETERIDDLVAGLKDRIAAENPFLVYLETVKDLNEALKKGLITKKEFSKGVLFATEDLEKAMETQAKSQVSVVGIQTALGTVKIPGCTIEKQQLDVNKSILTEAKETSTATRKCADLLRKGQGVFA